MLIIYKGPSIQIQLDPIIINHSSLISWSSCQPCLFAGVGLKHVNLEVKENHTAHRTVGLSSTHLVTRRGQPFKLLLYFHEPGFSRHHETLVFQAQLLVGLHVFFLLHLSNMSAVITVNLNDVGTFLVVYQVIHCHRGMFASSIAQV